MTETEDHFGTRINTGEHGFISEGLALREKTKNLKNSIGHRFPQMNTDFPQRGFKRFAQRHNGGKPLWDTDGHW